MSYSKNHNDNHNDNNLDPKLLALTAFTTALSGAGFFLVKRWHVAKPQQILVKTGAFLNNKMITGRSLFQFPFQEMSVVNLYPHTYQFSLHNMSKEKVEFKLPVVFTIGPISPEENENLFLNYCNKMNELSQEEIENTIKGMIEGETRTLTANMTIEEMFSSKEIFRTQVVEKISKDLEEFGLKIYNANIKEMTDFDEKNRYFEYRKHRAIQTANYEAQASVAKAQREGESNVAIEESINRQNKAKAQMEAELVENENKIKVAESLAKLSQAEAEAKQIKDVAFVEAEQATRQREIELQTKVDKQRHLQMIESERAKYLAKAMAESEAKERSSLADLVKSENQAKANVALAQAEAQARERNALADLVKSENQAKANVALAQAEAEAIERKSQAELIQAQRQAEGILANYQATAEGLKKVIESCGNPELAKFALALDKDLYQKLTHEMAQGLQGMKPNVTIIGNQKTDMLSPYVESAYQMAPFLKNLLDEFQQKSKSHHLEQIPERH